MKTIKAFITRTERLGIRRANRSNVHGACVPQFNSDEVYATLDAITTKSKFSLMRRWRLIIASCIKI
jgi:hypothetical protein